MRFSSQIPILKPRLFVSVLSLNHLCMREAFSFIFAVRSSLCFFFSRTSIGMTKSLFTSILYEGFMIWISVRISCLRSQHLRCNNNFYSFYFNCSSLAFIRALRRDAVNMQLGWKYSALFGTVLNIELLLFLKFWFKVASFPMFVGLHA